jgi:hypothetical protein
MIPTMMLAMITYLCIIYYYHRYACVERLDFPGTRVQDIRIGGRPGGCGYMAINLPKKRAAHFCERGSCGNLEGDQSVFFF